MSILPPEPPEGDEPLSPAGGTGGTIYGGNNVQKALDSTERTVTRLDAAANKMVSGVEKLVGFFGGSGSSKYGNGGQSPYSGAPTSHRAPGMASTTGGGGYTPQRRGSPDVMNRVAIGGAVAWGGAKAIGGVASYMSNPDEASMARVANMTGTYFAPGRNINERTLYGSRTAQSNTDVMQSVASLAGASQYVVGSQQFQRQLGGMTGASLINPMMSNAAAVQGGLGLTAGATFNTLRSAGIQTIVGGQAQNPRSIAQQILRTIPGANQIRNTEQMVAALSQNGGINQTLTQWVANGQLPAESYELVKTEIRGILTARVRGNMGFREYDRLSARAAQGNEAAAARLRGAGIGTSSVQQEREKEAGARVGSLERMDSFNAGLKEAADSLETFRDVINDITPKGLTELSGKYKGYKDQGLWGMFLGMISSSGAAASGGSTETRMSMGAGGATMAPQIGFGGPRPGTTRDQSQPAGQHGQGNMGGGKSSGRAGEKLAWPCHGPITARFGQAGGSWSSGHHTGLDIGVSSGTPIKAAADGTVAVASFDSSYGNQIVLNHGNGIQTRYGHNTRLKVHKGATVRQGEVIAFSGATGNVTGPHCHFEVILNGRPVDPEKYLSGGKTLDLSSSPGGGPGSSGSSSGIGEEGTSSVGAGQSFGMGYATSEAEIVAAALAGFGTSGAAAMDKSTPAGDKGSGSGSQTSGKHYSVGNVKPWVQEAADYLGSKYGIKTIYGYGTRSGVTDHDDGLALDFMMAGAGEKKLNALAAEVISKQRLLDVKYVIWKQRIQNLNSGDTHWRGMEDRGDPTSNHMDHVHVSFDSHGKVDHLVDYGGGGAGKNGGPLSPAERWLIGKESSGRTNANNPDSTAFGIGQLLEDNRIKYAKRLGINWQRERGDTGTTNYGDQLAMFRMYVHDRYQTAERAKRFWEANGWYRDGAWELPEDETARVHKGEMIIDAIKARQIREVMLHNNSYGASLHGGGGPAKIVFEQGSIQVTLTGADTRQPELAGRQIVDAFVADRRIKDLMGR